MKIIVRFKIFLLLTVGVLSSLTVFAFQSDDTAHATSGSAVMDVLAGSLPREKVYLHLDNTSYYFSDRIMFAAYVVSAGDNAATGISNTLYVELLDPMGKVVDTRVLKVVDGRAHGDFEIRGLPFCSGFYEIRAYTKYMLNFGEHSVYSRVIPVFEAPDVNGEWTSRHMRKFGSGLGKYIRKGPEKGDKLNVRFYPEGGSLVLGLPSRIAFEATDRTGQPVDVEGKVVNSAGEDVIAFSTSREGKGVFSMIPTEKGLNALVQYDGRTYAFDLPEPRHEGYVMTVNNVTDPDSVSVGIMRGVEARGVDSLYVAVVDHGILADYASVVSSFEKPVKLRFGTSGLSAGVKRVILFDGNGDVVADRCIFIHSVRKMSVKSAFDKNSYGPFEPVALSFSLKDCNGVGISSPFSLSVRDGDDYVDWKRNILTDLLLMSDVKGHIENPSYYFESDDYDHRLALDNLLMVQGWTRYPWEYDTDKATGRMRYNPENCGIETVGTVFNSSKTKGKPGVDVSAVLIASGRDEESLSGVDVLKTDSLGRFSFVSDVEGEWNMILAAREKGKPKDYLISIDRRFSPSPRQYCFADLELDIESDTGVGYLDCADSLSSVSGGSNLDGSALKAIRDSISYLSEPDRDALTLRELVVKGKKYSREEDIYSARSGSLVRYDVGAEMDGLRDNGIYVADDIDLFLRDLNKDFYQVNFGDHEMMMYKGGLVLFVVDYEPTLFTVRDMVRYRSLPLESIKSVYVSEDFKTMMNYCDPRIMGNLMRIYSCAVFIETYPGDKFPVKAGKGVRKTRFHGYNVPSEFYSPDYSQLEPDATDHRRTLYWNPDVTPDENGQATVRFYNNCRTRNFVVDMQTVTPRGLVGNHQSALK